MKQPIAKLRDDVNTLKTGWEDIPFLTHKNITNELAAKLLKEKPGNSVYFQTLPPEKAKRTKKGK